MASNNVFLPVLKPEEKVEFPHFAKPLEISHYSTDTKNGLHWDKRQLSSYAPPESIETLNLDLNDGFGLLVEQRNRMPGSLDNLLHWIIEENRRRNSSATNEFSGSRKYSLKDVVQGADIICWRGLFTKLGTTPYEERENWVLGAVRFQNVLFLVLFETDQEKERQARMTERDKRMTYWGHRFERYVARSTADNRLTEKDCVVDCNEQFCVVYRAKLGQSDDPSAQKFRLLYGAEIDCVDDRGRYIELKTSRVIDGWRQDRNFKKFKLIKWWLQSFLAGIDRIICGHRDDAGIIKHLTTYEVGDMPLLAAGGIGEKAFWSGATCMNFLFQLLAFVEMNVPHPSQPDCLGEIAVFEFHPPSRQVRLLNNHNFKSDQILPDWFVGAFGKV